MSRGRRALLLAIVGAAVIGCDGQDPERLNRVGKKLVEKGRRLTDDAQLPRVTVTMPENEKQDDKKPGNGEPKTEN
jgi:hypothetical protein